MGCPTCGKRYRGTSSQKVRTGRTVPTSGRRKSLLKKAVRGVVKYEESTDKNEQTEEPVSNTNEK